MNIKLGVFAPDFLFIKKMDKLKYSPHFLELRFGDLSLLTPQQIKRINSVSQNCEIYISTPIAMSLKLLNQPHHDDWHTLNEYKILLGVSGFILKTSQDKYEFKDISNSGSKLKLNQKSYKRIWGKHPTRWVRRYNSDQIKRETKNFKGYLSLAYSGRHEQWDDWAQFVYL